MPEVPQEPSSLHHLPGPSCCCRCSAVGGLPSPGLALGRDGGQAPAKIQKLRAGSWASEETPQGN